MKRELLVDLGRVDQDLRPFLPLIYVAWADGELSGVEAKLVRERVAHMPWLSKAARETLEGWLDPGLRPTARELAGVASAVRDVAGTLPEEAKRTLADLGVAMAAHSQGEQVRAAVQELEAALGLQGAEAAAALIHPQAPPPAPPARREPRFDVGAMTSMLERDHAGIRATVKRFLDDPAHRAAYDLTTEQHRDKVFDWLGVLARLGLGKLAYPGVTSQAHDIGPMLAAFETLALGDLSLLVKFGVQFGLFGGSVFFLGTDRHHEILPRVAAGELLGCFAMTEVGHGSNVMDLETTATFDAASGEFEVHTPRESARKDYIGNAARDGRLATVFAQLVVGGERHGVHALLVPIRDERGDPLPGVRIQDCGPKVGLNGVDNGRIWFDRVRVPREALLDRFARVTEAGEYQSEIASPAKRFFTMLSTLVGGRVCIAAAAASAAKVGLTIAVRYGSARRQFGPPGEAERTLLDYRTHQRRLLPRLAGTYALHFALEHLRERYLAVQAPAAVKPEGTSAPGATDPREVEALAAGLKAYATWHAIETIQICRECCGGAGYLAVNRLGSLKADTDVFTTFEGDNTVLSLLVSKSLLTGFKQQFAESRLYATVRWLAERARSAAVQKNPIVTRLGGTERLRDRATLLETFRAREVDLTASTAQRLKKRIDGGVSPFDAMAEVGDHLVSLARAHVERVVFERFAEAVQSSPAPLREPLDRVCDLWALWRLEADAAWFLENGYFEPPRARAVRRVVNELCVEVNKDAAALVEAFGIPDACLAAPIAFGDPAQLRW